jgi:anti-sigma B factor antagonist
MTRIHSRCPGMSPVENGGALMPEVRYRFQMVSGVPVVTAPAEIDVASAYQLRAALLRAAADGHATVVVDLAGTRFCDSAALNLLLRAHKRARAGGGELRLVIPAGAPVLRIFTVTGLDRVIPQFDSLGQALAQMPGAGEQGPVADTRACEQCGGTFVPQREHARFCSVGCRAEWNREHMGDPAVDASALAWSAIAMSEVAERLAAVSGGDRPRALAAVGEAVWWVTMVDATLVRHHRGVYDDVLAASSVTQRRRTEQALAGLRFVRNRIGRGAGLAELIGGEGAGTGQVLGWIWQPATEPELGHLRPRGQAWEMARYRAYQAGLAGRTIGETFRQAVAFLTLAGANVASNHNEQHEYPTLNTISSSQESSAYALNIPRPRREAPK